MIRRDAAHVLLSALFGVYLCTPSVAQWSESFENYTDGSVLEGQGGWHGWDGLNTLNSIVTSQFSSGASQSVMVLAGADSVQEFDGYDTGHWALSTQVYIPSSFVGKVYFLVLNSYRDGGPYQWSVQLAFNGDTGELECNCGSGTASTLPLQRDVWTELWLNIDLTADFVEVFYGGVSAGSYMWSAGPYGGSSFGLLQVDALDLFSDAGGYPHTTELYFDEFELLPYQGPVGTGYCFGDGSGTACPCANPGASDEGCANGSGVGARLTGFGSTVASVDDLTFTGTQLIPGQPGLLFSGMNAIGGGTGLTFGDGLRCAGGGITRLGVRSANAAGEATWGPNLGSIGGWQTGETRRFQVWYRDPAGTPCGSSFNLSHGVELTFTF